VNEAIKKPRGDSFLKTLPAAKRDQVWEWLQANTQAKTRALIFEHFKDEVAAWQDDQGAELKLAGATFTDFCEWYPLSMQLKEASTLVDQVKAALQADPDLDLDDDQLAKAGQMMFEGLAIKNRDSKLFVALKRLRQDAAEIGIREQVLRQTVRVYEDKIRDAQAALTEAGKAGGITPATLATIEEKLKLL
jgi:hypothetical protein